jgi:flagellar basal-body rod protein FlgF
MDRGLYIAATGMYAELSRQDQLANDLANASTPGYKPTRAAQTSFGEALVTNAVGQQVGSIGLGVQVDAPQVDLAQGPFVQTNQPLDVALEGPGFFRVQTANGPAYTRNGQFTTDASGKLITSTGAPVLDSQGRAITIPTGSTPSIGADGTISVNGKTLAKLGVVSLTNVVKLGDNDFSGTPGAAPAGTQVRQGSLEGSGADAAKSMIDMIVSMRAYESSQKVIQAIDETLQKGISTGSANGS